MSLVKDIVNDSQFHNEMECSDPEQRLNKLIVIDFYAVWCGPCNSIAPFIRDLSVKYPHVTFLKVDVEKLPDIANAYRVSAMPTFVFIKNKVKIDELTGANSSGLEAKIIKHAGDVRHVDGDVVVKGQVDLSPMILKENCECLNEANGKGLRQALERGSGYLESDADEQLIIYMVFNQVVKIHSICFDGPFENGPKSLKLYVNQTAPPDFENCSVTAGVQEIELTKDDLKEGNVTALKFVKFQNVSTLTIFINSNQNDSSVTRINHLALYGRPVATTNMSDLKKTSGQQPVEAAPTGP